jgi:hypothetical protein
MFSFPSIRPCSLQLAIFALAVVMSFILSRVFMRLVRQMCLYAVILIDRFFLPPFIHKCAMPSTVFTN